MCGRFVAGTDELTWGELVEILRPTTPIVPPAERAARPGAAVPVVAVLPDQGCTVFDATWGFRFQDKKLYFNIRAETVTSRFKALVTHGRCVLPARSFEVSAGPAGVKKRPRFQAHGTRALWLAGIWQASEEDPLGKRVSVLTCASQGAMAELHDRSPVLIGSQRLQAWLCDDKPVPLIKELLTSAYPALELEQIAV